MTIKTTYLLESNDIYLALERFIKDQCGIEIEDSTIKMYDGCSLIAGSNLHCEVIIEE